MRVETTLASSADTPAHPRRATLRARPDSHLSTSGADESDQPARPRWPETPDPDDYPDSRR